MLLSVATNNNFIIALGIILGAFVSEDGAIFAAATLASSKRLDISFAALSAFLGLWISDIGVYAAVRVVRERVPADSRAGKWLSEKLLSQREQFPKSRGKLGLAVSRFFPGMRFPAYVAAGLLRMPITTFSAITALSAAIWTGLVFLGICFFAVQTSNAHDALVIAGLSGLIVFVIVSAGRRWRSKLATRLAVGINRWRRWEFWPSWVFYPPVALMCTRLAIRFRGLSLPTVSNPGQRNGGIVGESKIEILRALMRTSPEATADAYLLETRPVSQRVAELESLCAQHEITFPFVLKPNLAQRGAGFRKIQSWREAGAYLAQVKSEVVLQRYVEDQREVGIFYYRFPGEERGHIFSITEKIFPVMTGDGQRTLEQLIRSDKRASLIVGTYLARFGHAADRIVPEGEHVRLVEAGNHCQGCIFRDGAYLNTEQLREAVDRIAKQLPGFFIGRFDVRYKDDEELRSGIGFTILELNGAASEATDIYDARNSLWTAYRKLYRQWELVYAIGAENRRRGFCPTSPFDIWRDWKQFRERAAFYPSAD